MVLVVVVVVADDPAGGEWIAALTAPLAMPITVRGHALIASSAIHIELAVLPGSTILARPISFPLVSHVLVVLRIQVTAVALVIRRARTAVLAISVR